MRLKRSDVVVGAYVHDQTSGTLYRIAAVPSTSGRTHVTLEDAASPLTSQRRPDSRAPGRLGPSEILQPVQRVVPLIDAQRRLVLVRRPASPDRAASADQGRPTGVPPA